MSINVKRFMDFGGHRLTGLPTPSASSDAAPKSYVDLNITTVTAYVDSYVEGLSWKDDVATASAAQVSLTSAPASMSGVTLVGNDRVLLMGQTNATENGIYVFTSVGAALTRSPDADSTNELNQATVNVVGGTYAGNTYRQSVANPVLGTSGITWVAFGSGAVYADLSTTNTGTSTTSAVTPYGLANSMYATRRYNTLIGDGSSFVFNITHNLGTRDVIVAVYDAVTYTDTLVEVARTTTNVVTVSFSSAPGANAYWVAIRT